MRFFLFSLSLFLISCTNTREELDASSYYSSYKLLDNNDKKNLKQITSIKIDTVSLNTELESSYAGHFAIHNDKVLFFDEVFNYVFEFDLDGNFLSKNLGLGQGPNEIPGFTSSVVSDDHYYFLNNRNSNILSYDQNFNLDNKYRINGKNTRSVKEVLDNPLPNLFDGYEFDYGLPDIFKIWDKNHFSMAITASHPKFNGYFNSDLYYNYSRIIALINIKSGEVVKLFGRRSPFYLENQNIPNFDHFSYEVSNDKVILSFMADKNIYLIDKQSDKLEGVFGVEGISMKNNYLRTYTYESADSNWSQDLRNYGYYTYLKYFDAKNIILRGYTKGSLSNKDGLQIYKNYQLIGDVEVPKNLKIFGTTDSTYFAYNSKSDDEILEFYKIQFQYETN